MTEQETENITRFLSRVPLFDQLKPGKLHKLAKISRERHYKEGDYILEQGKMGAGLFVIESGQAKVVRTLISGEVIELDIIKPPDFFGELSLLEETPRTASVIALEPTTCIAIAKLDFLDTLQEDAEMAVEMLKTLAHRYRRLIANM